MQQPSLKPIIASVAVIALIGIGGFLLIRPKNTPPPVTQKEIVKPDPSPKHEVIGTSVEGRAINVYTYGSGDKHVLFVGGIHGGYEWNSVLLAYQFMDYVKKNPTIISDNITVTVIPSANPDGVFAVVGKEGAFVRSDVPTTTKTVSENARFNANAVDLNRNFDCNWQPESTWKSKTVSAGTAPFSEPEAKALRGFITKNKIVSAIFWHSQSNAVYASECNNGILPETLVVMDTYAKAAGYPAVKSFDSYKITGDAEGWLASINIPAITVELKSHEETDWEKNLAGIKALFSYYSKE